MRCFRCQGLGHIASKCPNKRVVTLAEYQSICEHKEKPEEEGNKEIFFAKELEEFKEGPDDGEMLVVRRALSGLVALEN